MVSFGSSGQVKGRWHIPPGLLAFSRQAIVSRRTCFWPFASCAWPTGLPNGYSIAATLGMPIRRVNSGIIVRQIVEKPCASRYRATSPTDRQHRGQAGVSMTASTPSSCIFAATFGMVLSRRNEKSC